MLKQALLGDGLGEKAARATRMATVVFLGQELSGALHQLLEHTAGTLHSTCEQLRLLHDKEDQCAYRQGKLFFFVLLFLSEILIGMIAERVCKHAKRLE